ncbi:MAG: amino acid ABC transporter ATP-binding protein [Bifidobacteriaceae bacterium]|jgi:putative lysine transport system ATP-binding protein|nr:amino acid ABC transporter ATP-binding protein [Bifidobacteriaceae bacterium]
MKNKKDKDYILQVHNLNKSFHDVKVLKNINLDFKKGQTTTIIGPSGSGKSTLIRCLNRLETADSGEINFAGQNILDKNYNPNFVQKHISMVFQQFNLFANKSVLDNCAIGPEKVLGIDKQTARQRALLNLEKVGMKAFAGKLPYSLSGGQKQRVAIARALSMKPRAILFDEPTSALDPQMVSEVLDIIIKLAQEGLSMIVVTHEMQFAKDVSSDLIFLQDGEVVEQGDPKKILSKPKTSKLTKFLQKTHL